MKNLVSNKYENTLTIYCKTLTQTDIGSANFETPFWKRLEFISVLHLIWHQMTTRTN